MTLVPLLAPLTRSRRWTAMSPKRAVILFELVPRNCSSDA